MCIYNSADADSHHVGQLDNFSFGPLVLSRAAVWFVCSGVLIYPLTLNLSVLYRPGSRHQVGPRGEIKKT